LKEEFDLEKARIGLEKQEQAWKPTTFRRDEDHLDFERRAKGANAKSSTPKAPTTPNTNSKSKTPNTAANTNAKSKTPATKGQTAASKKQQPTDWYTKQYDAEELKVKGMGQSYSTPTKGTTKEQYAAEQQRLKDMKEEFAWKPKTWSG